jgi:hypothetical protein
MAFIKRIKRCNMYIMLAVFKGTIFYIDKDYERTGVKGKALVMDKKEVRQFNLTQVHKYSDTLPIFVGAGNPIR